MAIKDENKSVPVTFPKKFIEEVLDPDIKKEQRSRSRQIAKIVMDYYESKNNDCQK